MQYIRGSRSLVWSLIFVFSGFIVIKLQICTCRLCSNIAFDTPPSELTTCWDLSAHQSMKKANLAILRWMVDKEYNTSEFKCQSLCPVSVWNVGNFHLNFWLTMMLCPWRLLKVISRVLKIAGYQSTSSVEILRQTD